MKILIVSPGYPDRFRTSYPFVKQLVDAFSRQGNDCFVISPYSITKNRRFYKKKERDGDVLVYRPNYISFSSLRIGHVPVSTILRRIAVRRAYRWLPVKPDIIYCHFWICAMEGYSLALNNGIPLFVASGESTITSFINPSRVSDRFRNTIRGVICVSTKNKEESIGLGLTTEEKCLVKPNAVNHNLFLRKDRTECRERLGFPQNAFIVCFVGAFIERKGVRRVAKAITHLNDSSVYSIFIGSGDQTPDCNNILFKGRLCHDLIPDYLSASDVFVLPTLREGCCNAIVEAMACGLPVISSDRPFNKDILNASNSILIDPTSIEALSDAIEYLRDNPNSRMAMAGAALNTAKELTIDKRASDIIGFIKSKMNEP